MKAHQNLMQIRNFNCDRVNCTIVQPAQRVSKWSIQTPYGLHVQSLFECIRRVCTKIRRTATLAILRLILKSSPRTPWTLELIVWLPNERCFLKLRFLKINLFFCLRWMIRLLEMLADAPNRPGSVTEIHLTDPPNRWKY